MIVTSMATACAISDFYQPLFDYLEETAGYIYQKCKSGKAGALPLLRRTWGLGEKRRYASNILASA
jgi:hypothetical protein